MDSKDLQSRSSEQGKSAPVEYVPIPTAAAEEKIEVYIREVVRVKIGDVAAVKHSFENWAKMWD